MSFQVEKNSFTFKVGLLFGILKFNLNKLFNFLIIKKNVFENGKKIVEEFVRLKSIVDNDDENLIANLKDEQKQIELVALVNRLKQRLDFAKKRKSIRLLKRRILSKQTKSHRDCKSNNENDELIDFKINEFFQTEQLFGTFKKFDQNIEDQVDIKK